MMWLTKKMSTKVYQYAIKQHLLKRRNARNKCRLIDAFMGDGYCALAWTFYITEKHPK